MSFVIENPNPEDHLETEWLLTNGLGGYAMGTVLGVNTRRYHGLLVAATKPPVGRVVALHSMIEQLVIPREDGSEEVIDLSTQMFVGEPPEGEPMLHPDGIDRLISFYFDAHTRTVEWNWRIRGTTLLKSVEVNHEDNSLRLVYHMPVRPRCCRIRVRPLLCFRPFHELSEPVTGIVDVDESIGGAVSVQSRDESLSVSMFSMTGGVWQDDAQEWRNFMYSEERRRRFPCVEHVWSPGIFEEQLSGTPENLASLTFCMDRPRWREVDWAHSKRPRPGARLQRRAAARQFVVRRIEPGFARWSIIAGYPWFADWGRDAMISLPGLLLLPPSPSGRGAEGEGDEGERDWEARLDSARSVLETFARNMRNGLIPNRFDDDAGEEAHYNTVDASLWFVYAVWQVRSRQPSAISHWLLDACREIIRAYQHGTDFNIRMDPEDSLIAAGDESTQLTWMDAKRDGHVFTPRHGKAVEINALWYNALLCLAEMTEDESEARDLEQLAARAGESFRAKFWWEEKKCLHDVLLPSPPGRGAGGEGDISDRKLRPNQIFAVSLPHSPLESHQQRAVVELVKDKFLTPYGLRTLDRDDPDYSPRYEGDMWSRDKAYHNGTVWPWLIGPYCEALMRVNDFSEESKREARAGIGPLLDEMNRTSGRTCLGQIAEVYDGDPPHIPDGCPAQAWSVAEVLRILSMVGGEDER